MFISPTLQLMYLMGDESASRSIRITTEIFLAPSQIRTQRGRVMQLKKQALYLQATMAGYSTNMCFGVLIILKSYVRSVYQGYRQTKAWK